MMNSIKISSRRFFVVLCFMVSLVTFISQPRANLLLDTDPNAYVAPHVLNMEYIFWRYNVYDMDDTADIKRFIRLAECNVYRTYKNYDIEWNFVIEKYQNYLRDNKNLFPNKIRIKVPIGLKRFDVEKSVFPISESTRVDNVRIMPIKLVDIDTVSRCESKRNTLTKTKKEVIASSPVVSLKYPFTLNEIPIPRKGAKEYIDYVERYNKYNNKVNGRIAYAFMDIDIIGYVRPLQQKKSHLLYGLIRNVEVYADQDKEFILYQHKPDVKDMTSKKSLLSDDKDIYKAEDKAQEGQ